MRTTHCIFLMNFLISGAGCTTGTRPPGDGGGVGNGNQNANVNTNRNDNAGSNGLVDLGVDIAIPHEGEIHVETGTQVSYDANPPASGMHWPVPAAAGFYEARVEEEEWVHSLEHGYVVVLFDCDGQCDAGVLAELEDFFETAPLSPNFDTVKLVVTPYDGLPEPARITAVAWDVQLHLASFDDAALRGFYNRYVDQGPEVVP